MLLFLLSSIGIIATIIVIIVDAALTTRNEGDDGPCAVRSEYLR